MRRLAAHARALVTDPGCDGCANRYRAVFVEGLDFPFGEACASDLPGCDPSSCVTVASATAESLHMWCDSPEEHGR